MRTSSSDEVLRRLKEYYVCTERRGDPFKVLISTILSQRTKDENTDRASEALFEKFSAPVELAQADLETVEELIRPSGFYHVKAKRIVQVSRDIVERFNGKVPDSLELLLSLEGVGRKTANCVLVYGFGQAAIPVDVHVHRIANRLGLVSTRTPEKTEKALMGIFPETEWISVNYVMVRLGREICRPRNPLCTRCVLKDICLTGTLTQKTPE